ncbi:FAD-dependent oxidoreductase [Streptomyces sp. NPDC049040]|uniref:FAD-dependent oxidoreductase n=1 Tax=Streptomyces sp. NPDC049040 TaxID=3365593 RepID=UPI003721EDB9
MPNNGALPGAAESYWMSSTDSTRFAPLTADVTVDVAVVGGGIAGLSAAWEAAESGRSVAVVEADRIAAGVSGYTTAKLTAQHGLIYERLLRTRGPQGARTNAARSALGGRVTRTTISAAQRLLARHSPTGA